MPELPEVEIVARSLNDVVRGRVIADALLHREKLAPSVEPSQFSSNIKGRTIKSVSRRGKHILMNLSGEVTLVVHLRMSGRFILLDADDENPTFTHAEFFFPDEQRLIFQDQRHFGYMNIAATQHLETLPEIAKLAPEPLSGSFNRNYLKSTLKATRRPLKDLLLDQTKVCGLGNIYAAEAMFLARLHPRTISNTVSSVKAHRLHDAIQHVLSESIEAGLSKRLDPGNIENRYFNGSSAGEWLVYDREGAPCHNCRTKIRRVKQSGRSSYFCPRCQRK
jgi:formamidopyrimidine-DNA glycosylase